MNDLRRELRAALLGPFVLALAYLVARFVFDRVTRDGGLLTPSGAPDLGAAAVGLVVIALRVIVVFAVPAVVAYRLVALALRRQRGQRTGGAA